ncbi:hypothetical protein A1359_18740 [Methylomonas lenta]|uniref:Uncharacterized protein n=1 Tax=Methylomonas lenta TaxID=980561 RepID=A0A177MWL2_9GAMM|nr:hypothetical protein [Methylomonas lenta]OAI09653.1 hypothetical protein A1359_18740 [Methylomonas lenta]
MNNQPFDLNDIENEPSDEQLQVLMNAVAVEARNKARIAREQLMDALRKEINRVNEIHEGL